MFTEHNHQIGKLTPEEGKRIAQHAFELAQLAFVWTESLVWKKGK